MANCNSNNANLLIDVANWYSFTNKKSAPDLYVSVSSTVYLIFSIFWFGLEKWKQAFLNFLYFSNAYIRVYLDEKCIAVAQRINILTFHYKREMFHCIIAYETIGNVRSRSAFHVFCSDVLCVWCRRIIWNLFYLIFILSDSRSWTLLGLQDRWKK